MKLIIHDLENSDGLNLAPEDKKISANKINEYCRGCFGCWVKTPGQCVLRDGFEKIGIAFSKADEIVIISRCVYGSVSPQIKRVIDRSIGYAHPFFVVDDKVMHHKRRYTKHFKLHIYFYGETLDYEKETAQRFADLLKAKYAATDLKLDFQTQEEMIAL